MAALKPATVHLETARTAAGAELRLVVENLTGPAGGQRSTLWWRRPEAESITPPPVLDALVLPLALYAQAHGQDLRVQAPMSRTGLFGLHQLMEARHGTTPETYPGPITVTPESVLEPAAEPRLSNRALLAFSGGLDSTFSAVRHGMGLRGPASYDLAGLVMVHGLDAPLADTAGFAGMLERAQPVARRVGVPILPVITDSMRLSHTAPRHGALWPH